MQYAVEFLVCSSKGHLSAHPLEWKNVEYTNREELSRDFHGILKSNRGAKF